MTDPSVRTIRRADELQVGDWLAASMAEDDAPTEVAALVPYSTAENGPFIEITYRQPDGGLGHWPVLPEAVMTLATAAEVAEQQASAGRARVAVELVRLADLILQHELPVAASHRTPTVAFPLSEDVVAVERVASVLGRKAERTGRNVTVWLNEATEGPVGVYWSAFEPKDAEPETKPDPDPTGLLHSRADDADDPTPVSPGRVPLHTGGVVDGGVLVDETPGGTIEDHLAAGGTIENVDGLLVFSGGLVDETGCTHGVTTCRCADADTVPVPAEDATLTPLPAPRTELLAIVPTATGVVVTSAPVGAVTDPVRRAHVVELTEAAAEQLDATAFPDEPDDACHCGDPECGSC